MQLGMALFLLLPVCNMSGKHLSLAIFIGFSKQFRWQVCVRMLFFLWGGELAAGQWMSKGRDTFSACFFGLWQLWFFYVSFDWIFFILAGFIFNFFGVRYCQFCLKVCKLVKKQDRSEVSQSFPCNLIFRLF